jgi:hypothetical protein
MAITPGTANIGRQRESEIRSCAWQRQLARGKKMGFVFLRHFARAVVLTLLVASLSPGTTWEAYGAQTSPGAANTSVGALLGAVRERARILESSSEMKLAFQSFTRTSYRLTQFGIPTLL